MPTEFFVQRPSVTPTIYAYSLPDVASHKGYIKVGYTERDVEKRIAEQMHTSGVSYKILLKESAMCQDGTCFSDHDVHAILRRKGFSQFKAGADRNEWFKCSIGDIRAALTELHTGIRLDGNRTQTFKMRPEQQLAVKRTMEYYASAKKDEPTRAPKFLWNAKMRFGKTFASYELAKKMGFKRILVLTFKPAVESAWSEDLMTHVDFEGWQFVSNKDAHTGSINIDQQFAQADKSHPIVVFGSFQDLLGTNENGGIKAKNEFIHSDNWDLVIFDEYHFGAWRENAKKLFDNPDEEADTEFDPEQYKQDEADNAYNETFLPITTSHYLFLSGTPFRALNSGEFIEDQIYNWTYSDEQRAKENWIGSGNPYLSLPRMVMLTYRIPDSIRQIAMQGEFDEFDLNIFFSAKGKGAEARFTYENEVQKWLDLIRGSYLPASVDDLKLGQDKRPPMPYSDTRLLNVLSHTMWFLPNVASCQAMANLLAQKQNSYYNQKYKVIVCAGTKAGIGLDALAPVQAAMGDPLVTNTITLSCGKLTTGVTIRPWTGIFMLRNLKSPETYFQAAFRVQSPWEVKDDSGERIIMKQECYVFDFALDRALRQISDYSCRLDVNEGNPEKKVAEFINFLPVLAYDGSTMRQINAQDVLDIAMAGTSATLLAKRWESALLVNVDNDTLTRLMNNKDALEALMNIEGFRSLNSDIETIINKSEAVKKAKKDGDDKLTPKEKKELSDEEKEYKSMRKQIQEKLIKFATRVPVFMYLTDYRERSLKDVITQLEPGLFKKVTGLGVKDFELLCSIGVFNASLMNDAIFKFKRYEDSSLSYTGIDKHEGKDIGGWDTVIKREEYERLFYNQQSTMDRPGIVEEPEVEDEPVPEVKKPTAPVTPVAPKPALVTEAYGIKKPDAPKTPVVTPAQKPKEPELDLSGVEVGSAVTHKAFGAGTVTWIDKAQKHIRVTFSAGEKTFIFPDAFKQGFLKI
ncbi:GIY-YIG nuclease family protein [Dehalococcoides mccartyi]|uniref:GIY-YIG nuclease family protein n=1 Tax=Dehalococcoides mccartyi TaxID=61435 RepID=UPI0019F3B507|nr:GIY-YIG nuclease family protein [Dehalococcoides mccartyi]MBF4482728.1 GIY-YIG nuclease family protein [Dehalococcoides mccartyi]MBJ7532273.1 GIY-YIG nuclease family protein [Dehalococcoides mccartyi]